MAHRLAFLTAAILTLAAASGARSTVATVVAGTDYLQTTSGTYFDFGSQMIPLEGDPIGPFNTDTIVERTSDVTAGGPLLVTALSLESTVPVMGATIYVTLDPTKLADDTGTITISGVSNTFSSTLDVFFDVCLAPGAGGVGCAGGAMPLTTGSIALTNTDSPWSPTPSPGDVIVSGPVGDLAANVHTGLSTDQVDFFPGLIMKTGSTGGHNVMPATVPETSTWVTLLVGFGGLGALAAIRCRETAGAAAS